MQELTVRLQVCLEILESVYDLAEHSGHDDLCDTIGECQTALYAAIKMASMPTGEC